jgi:hypothetical protein
VISRSYQIVIKEEYVKLTAISGLQIYESIRGHIVVASSAVLDRCIEKTTSEL